MHTKPKKTTTPQRKTATNKKPMLGRPPGPPKQAQAQTMKQANRGMKSAPLAMTKARKPQGRPKITHNPDGSCRVQYKEFVVDVTATPDSVSLEDGTTRFTASPFESIVYDINPGNEELFRWFSIMSKGYEMYQVHKMGFEFDPSCPTTTQGTVMLATDFDAFDEPPFDKQEMMAMKGAQRCAPWEPVRNTFTSKDVAHSKDYYIRDAPPAPEQDITLLDVGKFILSTASILSGLLGSSTGDEVTLGELYVDYDITLKNPTAERSNITSSNSLRIAKYPGTDYDYEKPFGDNPVIVQNTTTPVFDYDDTTGEFTCNRAGEYLFVIRTQGGNPGISHDFVYDPVTGTPTYTFWNDMYIPPVAESKSVKASDGILQCGW